MKSRSWILLNVLAVALLFAGMLGQSSQRTQAQDGTQAPTVESSLTFEPVATQPLVEGKQQELHIYNWTTYIADDTISNFEKLYNVKVTYDTYTSMDELYAKLQAGNPGYDVIVPTDYEVQLMNKAGLLDEIDLSQIPNFTANVSEQFKNPAFDPGNKHCIAYQWGTVGVGYSPEKVGSKITSWADLFDAKLKGRVALLNNSREMIATILIYLGKNPNSVSPDDLNAVKDFILSHKDVIAAFHDSDGQFKLAKGEVDAISDWSGDMFQVMADPANAAAKLEYVIPKEGAVLWTDNMCIPKGAPNKDLALKFLNYIYLPNVAASISNYTQYGSPNGAAIKQGLIDKAALENPAIYPPEDIAKRLYILGDIGDAQALYDQIWSDIKAGVSQ